MDENRDRVLAYDAGLEDDGSTVCPDVHREPLVKVEHSERVGICVQHVFITDTVLPGAARNDRGRPPCLQVTLFVRIQQGTLHCDPYAKPLAGLPALLDCVLARPVFARSRIERIRKNFRRRLTQGRDTEAGMQRGSQCFPR